VGVVSFGFLGHSNAKFGRIDAHIAVCAWDRKILIDAARIAERRGYRVVHGIIDSLWLKKEGADDADYLELKKEIEEETGFPISFEGIYKWVAFLPSKVDAGLPVLNRYFGAYRSGKLKVRGIEARRHDTPLFFKRCQMEILGMFAKADSVKEAREMLPACVETFLRCADALNNHEVPAEELAFSVNISKKPEEYVNNTVQTSAIRQLTGEGVEIHAGEGIRYVVRDYRSGGPRRAVPADFLEGESDYDHKRYIELLAEACASVLQQFDAEYDADRLSRASKKEGQTTLPLTEDEWRGP
jgi:DNA polymerase-2